MSNSSETSSWLKRNLANLVPFLVSDDIIQTIMTFENDRDLDFYMKSLTDTSSTQYKNFLATYKKIRSLKDFKENENGIDYYNIKHKDSKNKKKGNSEIKDKKNVNNNSSCQFESVKDKEEKQSAQKKKTKYVSLYSPAGKQKDVVLLKGRHPCECQASKHELIGNCLKCGRIICQQEGSGPCLFCGTMVLSKGERNIINSNTQQSRKLYMSLMESQKNEEYEQAVEKRNKLLEFDKTSAQRTKVIDDEGEYFSSNSVWLSKEERETLQKKEAEAHAKKHASRLEKKFTLDFAGRTVIEESAQDLQESFEDALSKIETSLSGSYTNPNIDLNLHPLLQYPDKKMGSSRKQKFVDNLKATQKLGNYRVQDKELLEMSDNGVCLSLHQPWASLLVYGIMRYEGRTWYTPHRGRLWIAAASRQPSKDEIRDAENFFKEVRHGENLIFPRSYPTSVLLGCVLLTDCLPQEEFRLRYPAGECDSSYVFICEDPRPLDTFFPVSGSHKIYKLDSKIHQAANKVLLRMLKQLNSK